jgi:hypothetical protein
MHVDYGEQGPEHLDRFGTHQIYEVVKGGDSQFIVPLNYNKPIRRLTLQLRRWLSGKWYDEFQLLVGERPMEIRHYPDGRLKVFVDNEPVYEERVRTRTREGIKHQVVEKWYDAETAKQRREEATARELDGVKAMLADRLKGL